MRALKFRVWNEEVKKYMEVDLNGKFSTGYVGAFDGNVWEQFTGQYDMNKKEIYEGDIVRMVYDGIENFYIVVFDICEFDFKGTNGKENYGKNFEYLSVCEEIEIVGNIHYNKLEQFKKTLED